MDVVSTVILGVLISAIGLILGRMTIGLRQEFAEFRKEMKADLRATEERLAGRIDGLGRSVDGMRSDVTQVALAVGVKLRAPNG
jgi:hypothetical protein